MEVVVWSHGPGPTRLLQLQKELIRTGELEGAAVREEVQEGLAERGPPGRQRWGQPSHNPGRGSP